jgi:Flp pilus assembly protein TadG
MIPTILLVGMAIDFSRQIQLYRAMQNAADSAALAGATLLSESTYAQDIPPLVNAYLRASTSAYNATITLPAAVTVTADSVTVTLSGSITTTLLSYLTPTLPTSVTAVAGGPEAALTITATPTATNSSELNSLYAYAVTASGSKDISRRTLVVNNNSCYFGCVANVPVYPAGTAVSVPFSLGLGERVAFELDVVTNGRIGTLVNNYYVYNGVTQPTVYGSMPCCTGTDTAATAAPNVYYSSDYPATLNTVPARPATPALSTGYSAAHQAAMVNAGNVNFDSSATACYVYQGEVVPVTVTGPPGSTGTISGLGQQQPVIVNGHCANVTPGSPYNINPTCLELNGQSLLIDWNDMGGPLIKAYGWGDTDRYISVPGGNTFTDMEYTVSCAANPGPYLRVVLTQ